MATNLTGANTFVIEANGEQAANVRPFLNKILLSDDVTHFRLEVYSESPVLANEPFAVEDPTSETTGETPAVNPGEDENHAEPEHELEPEIEEKQRPKKRSDHSHLTDQLLGNEDEDEDKEPTEASVAQRYLEEYGNTDEIPTPDVFDDFREPGITLNPGTNAWKVAGLLYRTQIVETNSGPQEARRHRVEDLRRELLGDPLRHEAQRLSLERQEPPIPTHPVRP